MEEAVPRQREQRSMQIFAIPGLGTRYLVRNGRRGPSKTGLRRSLNAILWLLDVTLEEREMRKP